MEFFATVPPTSLIIVVSSLSEAPSGHCCWWPDECLVISNSWLISWFSVATNVLLTHSVCCVVSSFLWELVALRWTRREKQQQPQQHNRVSAPAAVASNRNTLGEIKKSCWHNDPTNNMSQTNAQSIGQWPRTQHTSNCWHPCWPFEFPRWHCVALQCFCLSLISLCVTAWVASIRAPSVRTSCVRGDSHTHASVECCSVRSCCFFQANFGKVWVVGRLQEDEEKLQIISCWPTPVLLFVFWVVSKPCDLFVSLSRWGLRSLLLPAGR